MPESDSREELGLAAGRVVVVRAAVLFLTNVRKWTLPTVTRATYEGVGTGAVGAGSGAADGGRGSADVEGSVGRLG